MPKAREPEIMMATNYDDQVIDLRVFLPHGKRSRPEVVGTVTLRLQDLTPVLELLVRQQPFLAAVATGNRRNDRKGTKGHRRP